MKDRFAHGTKNDINALASLVGKILPTFYPHLSFQEDGCDIINLPGGYCVISGDGSGVNQEGINHVAIEFKCPMPGKKYTTETYYKLPVYYVLQVLSQMVAKNAGEFANLCYTQESSTLLVGEFNKVRWDKTKCMLDYYFSSSQKRPTRKPKWSNEMFPCLRDFAESARFVCEVPSLRGIACSCPKEAVKGAAEIRNYHGEPRRNSTVASLTTSMESFAIEVLRAKDALKEAYDQVRRQAKEILLTMISDLDRMPRAILSVLPHAVPMMYHMAGYSLKINSVRSIMKEALGHVKSADLVRCIAFDGQFAELSVQNQDRPLTVCRLAKQIWDLSKSKKKNEQLKWLFDQVHVERSLNLNDTFCINKQENQGLIVGARTVYKHVITPHKAIVQLMNRGTASIGREENCTMENDVGWKIIFYSLCQKKLLISWMMNLLPLFAQLMQQFNVKWRITNKKTMMLMKQP